MWVRSLGQEDPLEKEMATNSSILAGRIPRTEEPGGLWSMGSHDRECINVNSYNTLLWVALYFPQIC